MPESSIDTFPPMLGNDIVDLSHSDARNFHPRFSGRICTGSEENCLKQYKEQSAQRLISLWTIWSIKEAAFKAIKRYDTRLPFRWKAFDTALEPGKVYGPHHRVLNVKTYLYTESKTGDRTHRLSFMHAMDPFKVPLSVGSFFEDSSVNNQPYILHSTVFTSDISPGFLDTGIHRFNPEADSESNAVRRVVTCEYAQREGIEAGRISWTKSSAGAPVGHIDGKPAPWLISFSHHGNYAAWAGIRSFPYTKFKL